DDQRRVIRVLGKGRKERAVPYGVPAQRALDGWRVRGRPAWAGTRSGSALLLGARGGRIDPRTVRAVVHTRLASVPGAPGVGPHGNVADEERAEIEAAVATLWRDYKTTKQEKLRERLILHYSPLVKYVAGRVGVGLPSNIEQADLVSYGIFGLIDAIEKFDLGRAIKFETYAISRIKGAIIDELRAIDWIPRSVRYKAREVEKAYASLEARLHRTPTEPEVADEL